MVPALALFTALVVGGLVIVFSDPDTLDAWGEFFCRPRRTLSRLVGPRLRLLRALCAARWARQAAIGRTLVEATPLALAGLSVALAFRAGLFNIGGAGQLIIGAIVRRLGGLHLRPAPRLHLPLAVIAGALGGAVWGGIAGFLKARTGAHEVITTIMLNYIAYRLLDYAAAQRRLPAAGPQRPDLQAGGRVGAALPEVSFGDITVHARAVPGPRCGRGRVVAARPLDRRASACGPWAPTPSPRATPA